MELKSEWFELNDSDLDTFNRTILELKYRAKANLTPYEHPFNRTILELKYAFELLEKCKENSFNRTILELKSNPRLNALTQRLTFNRTILELKFPIVAALNNSGSLLIAPFWN